MAQRRSGEWWMLAAMLALVLGGLACSEGTVANHSPDIAGDGTTDNEGGPDLDLSDTPDPPVDGTTEVSPDTAEVTPPDAVETTVPDTDPTDVSPGCSPANALRCSSTGNVEICYNGRWILSEICDRGCTDGVCDAPVPGGTCAAPLPLTLGATVIGTTDTVYNPNTWLQACSNPSGYGMAPTGPETVYALDLPTTMLVKFTVTALDQTYFGLYIRGTCDNPASQLHSACSGSPSVGGFFSVTTLMAPGTHYVFVDDFNLQNYGPGRFQLKAEQVIVPSCGALVPTIINVDTTPTVVSGDTANGSSMHNWLEYNQGCDAFQTGGKELIYAFALRNPSKLNVSVLPLDPADSKVAVYVRQACNDRFSQVACGYSPGNQAATITDAQLEAGGYYLFVDDFLSTRPDTPQSFDMTLSYR